MENALWTAIWLTSGAFAWALIVRERGLRGLYAKEAVIALVVAMIFGPIALGIYLGGRR